MPATLGQGDDPLAGLPGAPGMGDPLPGLGDVSGDPADVGRWTTPFDGHVPAINMVLLNDGRVLYWSGVEADATDDDTEWTFFTSEPVWGESRIVDLSTDPPTVTTPNDPHGAAGDLFCAGQMILPDGRVLTIGSSQWTTLPTLTPFLTGGADTRIFDPATDTWTRAPDMSFGRWYPSIIETADGDALAISGITSLSNPLTQVEAVEHWDDESTSWSTIEDADRLLPLYPRVTLVPGGPLKGDVFYNTVGTLWGPFGEHPLEALWFFQQTYDTPTNEWRFLGPSTFGVRQHAASVMLPLEADNDYAPRFVTFGGTIERSTAATALTEINDLATDPPTNTPASSMNWPRWHLNGVGLPDGTVLAVGGALYDNVVVHGQPNVPILAAEGYDPATDTWTEFAPMEVPRMYHSTALLLADGRVLVGGHVPLPNPFPAARDSYNPQVVENRLEIFEPPYLFRGERPVIRDAPTELSYDQQFAIFADLPDGRAPDSVVLIHPGSTTHAFDMAQRSIELNVVRAEGNALILESPPDGTVAPPGHYMLFVNGQHPDGPIPSEAAWVHLD